ncbi:MAG: VWA domain-containing protein [Gammaproteobacteria bacterium]|nr:VWA domain-containing protein [Gammaproteobacteria bacterium]
MNFSGSKSEWFCMTQLRSFILISALSIPVLVLSLVPHAWGSELKQDIIMVMDNSGSMKKNDPEFLARRALKAFISESDSNTNLALIIFDQDVKLAIPLTPLSGGARPLLLHAMQEIDYSGSLTNSPAALERAIYEIALHGRDDADKSIILITDGIVDTGNKARDKQQEDWMLEELSTLASNLGIKVFGIAFAEAANYQLIQSLTAKTGGDHFRVLLAEDLPNVFARLEEIYHPPATSLSQESQLPETMIEPQLPSDSMGDTQAIDTQEALPAMTENEAANEMADGNEPMDGPERLAQSKPISMPNAVLGNIQQLYANNRMMIAGALFIFLVALGAFFILRRKNMSRRRRRETPSLASTKATVRIEPGSISSPSTKEDQEKALLIDINGYTSNHNYSLSKKITKIGRVSTGMRNDTIQYLLLDKPTIGREHALIEYEDDGYWLVDRDSTNGTFIDGKRVRGRALLKNGNKICFHDIEFIFSVPNLNKLDATVSVPIVGSREDSGQAETLFQLASKNKEHKKPFKTTGLPRAEDSNNAMEDWLTTNQEDLRHKPKIAPELETDPQNRRVTQILSDTELPPHITADEWVQESKRETIDKTEVMPPSQTTGNASYPMTSTEMDIPNLDVTQPSSNTVQQAEESDSKHIENTEVMLPLQTKEHATDPMPSSDDDTPNIDATRLSPISDATEQVQKSKQEIIEKTKEMMDPSQTKEQAADPMPSSDEESPDPDATRPSPTYGTIKRAQASSQTGIEKTQVLSPSQIKKKIKDLKKSTGNSTLVLDSVRPPQNNDQQDQAAKSKKTDTERIPQDVLEALFKPEKK